MNDSVFLDSNLLVYIYDSSEPDKRRIAAQIIEEEILADRAVLSIQVLQEFYVSVTRKLEPPLDPSAAHAAVEALTRLRVVLPRPDTVLAAIRRSQRDVLSFWDAMIVEAALSAGCVRLWSEDLQDGRRFGDLIVSNPFAAAAAPDRT